MELTIENVLMKDKDKDDIRIEPRSLRFLEEYQRSYPYSLKTMIPAFYELQEKGYLFLKVGTTAIVLKKIGEPIVVKIFLGFGTPEKYKKEFHSFQKYLYEINFNEMNEINFNTNVLNFNKQQKQDFNERFGPLKRIFKMDESEFYYSITMPFLGHDLESCNGSVKRMYDISEQTGTKHPD